MLSSRNINFPSQTTINSSSFRDLTYLQFCMLPHLFKQYIQLLSVEQNYKTIGQIFILYSQTLFQLIPIPTGNYNMTSTIFASVLGQQFVKLLTIVISHIPMGSQQLIFTKSIPTVFYSFLCSIIIDFLEKGDQQNNIKFKLDNKAYEKSYYFILGDYYSMLAIEEDVKKGKKVISPLSQASIKQQLKNYQKNSQLAMKQSHLMPQQLKKFVKKFSNLLQKLNYVFQTPIQIQAQPQSSMKSSNEPNLPISLLKTHLNSFYLRCISNTEKLSFIRKKYENLVKAKHQNQIKKKIAEVQLMCLLYLQENKTQPVVQKLQIYIILAAIKVEKDKNIEGLIQQVKVLLSFDRIPKTQFMYLLVSVIISITTAQTSQISQLTNLILKAYMNSPQSSNKSYIKLAILSSLYANHKNPIQPSNTTSSKSNNRRIQLQKLCEYYDVVQYISNLEIIDYLIELVWNGKQLKMFGGVHVSKNQMQLQGTLESIFNQKDAQPFFRQYLFKNATYDQIDLEISNQKLINLLSSLITKRIQISNQSKLSKQHLQNCFLSLVFQYTNQSTPNYSSLLQFCISILKQYCIIATYHSVSQKLSKLLFFILYFTLSSTKQRKQATICLILSGHKINYDKIQSLVRNHPDQFSKINSQLFNCILNYDFIEILLENYRGVYGQMLNQWVKDNENYIYSWPDTRKDKILQSKRNKFMNYLANKSSEQKQNE